MFKPAHLNGGVIAEAAFNINVISNLEGWADITPNGDLPYDFF